MLTNINVDVDEFPGNFPMEQPKKSCAIYFQPGFSGNFW